MGFDRPGLVYPLPCVFNRQLGTDYDVGIWEEIFDRFHRWAPKEVTIVAKILRIL